MRPLVGVSARGSQTRRLPVAIWWELPQLYATQVRDPLHAKNFAKNSPQRCIPAPKVRWRTLPLFFERVLGSEEHEFGDSTVDEIHSRREKEVRDDIARRLKPVCSNFPDDEFQKLVKTMADNQVKCERRLIW